MRVCYNRLAQINSRRAASCEEVQCWAHKRVAMPGGAMEASLGNCGWESLKCGWERAQQQIISLHMRHLGCSVQAVVIRNGKFAKPVMLHRVVASED
jgi:hypothetical protein